MTHKSTTIKQGSAGHIDIEQWSCANDTTHVDAGDGYVRLQARRVNRGDGVEDEVQIELKVGTFDKNLGLRAQYASLILNPAQTAELIAALSTTR